MIVWKTWRLRDGALEFYIFRPRWRTITLGIGWSYEPHPREGQVAFAVGPFHAGMWWRRSEPGARR